MNPKCCDTAPNGNWHLQNFQTVFRFRMPNVIFFSIRNWEIDQFLLPVFLGIVWKSRIHSGTLRFLSHGLTKGKKAKHANETRALVSVQPVRPHVLQFFRVRRGGLLKEQQEEEDNHVDEVNDGRKTHKGWALGFQPSSLNNSPSRWCMKLLMWRNVFWRINGGSPPGVMRDRPYTHQASFVILNQEAPTP